MAREPRVPRAVLMQHHPRHLSARTLAPMRAAPQRAFDRRKVVDHV